MRKPLILAFLLPFAAVAAGNPLLSAPANNAAKWSEKMKEFQKPRFPAVKKYPKPFHYENHYSYSEKDICSSCHTFAAHKKDKKYSPFYNAHGTFLSCNVCHFVRPNLKYAWAEIEDGKVKILERGDFYGLRYVKVGNSVMLSGQESTARIVPIYNGEPVEIPLKGNEDLIESPKAVARMHNALSKKALKCEDCHKEKGVLNFRELGFSPQRVKDLEHNEIVKGLKEYKSIHFPKFIW